MFAYWSSVAYVWSYCSLCLFKDQRDPKCSTLPAFSFRLIQQDKKQHYEEKYKIYKKIFDRAAKAA